MPLTTRKLAASLAILLGLAGCVKREVAGPTPEMDSEGAFWIRVLLLDDVNECELSSAYPISVVCPDGGLDEAEVLPKSETIRVKLSAGILCVSGKSFDAGKLSLSSEEPHIFAVNGEHFRGRLTLVLNSDANSFDVINYVPLEPYLAGVIGAEMPPHWESEALKAQAIAARTYCLYIKNRFGGGREWDVKRTQAHQVYHGVKAESARIWDAVNNTRGQVCVCAQGGKQTIFPTYYSSTCGGHTENSKNVFGDSFEPLAGVPCPYCKEIAKAKFFLWPMARYGKADVTARLLQRYPSLEKLDAIEDIRVIRQSDYGSYSRLTNIQLIGSNGQKDSLRGEDLRLAIDPSGTVIKSAIFKIECIKGDWTFFSGRGYGHGVGMCQCGAEALARKGKTSPQILSYYYPGSKIARIY